MIGARIKERRKAAHMTQQDLGEAVGFVKTTVCSWEKGKFKPDVDTIEKIASVLNTSPRYILGYTDDPRESKYDDSNMSAGVGKSAADYSLVVDSSGSMYPNLEPLPAMQRVPLIGSIACGDPITAEENIEDYVQAPVDKKCHFALRCKGDSMAPRLMEGDLVYIRQQPDVEDGQIAAVIIDGEATLKHVYHIQNGVQLVSDNPAYAPLIYTGDACAELRIVGLAVAYQRML